MNDERIRSALSRAIELTSDVEPPLRHSLVGEVFRALIEAEPAAASAPARKPAADTLQTPTQSNGFTTLGEAIASLPPRSHTELLPAIAAHKLASKGIDSLSAEDFVEAYRELRLSRPQNLSDTIAKSIRQGWLVPGDKREGKKTWRVSSLGLSKVDELRKTARARPR